MGYSRWSTIEPAPEAILLGKVASGNFSLKTTVLASGVSTSSSIGNMIAGPVLSLISRTRSKEYLTSFEVRSLPLLNFRPSRNVQVKTLVCRSVKRHLRAASGSGWVAPLGKLSSDWKTLLNSSHEPGS